MGGTRSVELTIKTDSPAATFQITAINTDDKIPGASWLQAQQRGRSANPFSFYAETYLDDLSVTVQLSVEVTATQLTTRNARFNVTITFDNPLVGSNYSQVSGIHGLFDYDVEGGSGEQAEMTVTLKTLAWQSATVVDHLDIPATGPLVVMGTISCPSEVGSPSAQYPLADAIKISVQAPASIYWDPDNQKAGQWGGAITGAGGRNAYVRSDGVVVYGAYNGFQPVGTVDLQVKSQNADATVLAFSVSNLPAGAPLDFAFEVDVDKWGKPDPGPMGALAAGGLMKLSFDAQIVPVSGDPAALAQVIANPTTSPLQLDLKMVGGWSARQNQPPGGAAALSVAANAQLQVQKLKDWHVNPAVENLKDAGMAIKSLGAAQVLKAKASPVAAQKPKVAASTVGAKLK